MYLEMEELQDALEDAQYVNAINLDEGPRPITAWEKPSEEEMEKWKMGLIKKWNDSSKKNSTPEPFSFGWAMAYPLGFFMLSSFIKQSSDDYVQITFIEEILRWRYLRGRSRGSKIRKIYDRYLTPGDIDEETKERKKPKLYQIDETDLEYVPGGNQISQEELSTLVSKHIDDSCSKNTIGIDGPFYDEVMKKIHECLDDDVSTLATDDVSAYSTFSSQTSFSEQNPADEPASNSQEEETAPISPKRDKAEEKEKAMRSKHLTRAPKDIFDNLEQVVVEIIRMKHWNAFKQTPDWTKLIEYLWHRDRKITDEDFFLMRVLGRGGFGLVTACKKGTTGTLYAMKVMNKKRIRAKKSEQLALNERACLAAVDSPFVVNLKYSFQTKEDLYLILDLMTGGDLSFHLSQKGRFEPDECLYYAARIMLGLQALHDKNYVYRDLKPENLLLAEDGRVRITDLGLATQVTSRLHGAAGTRGYWAPEMLRRNDKGKRMNYDHRVDWFSYGCVVAEMICGCNPFRSESALKFGLSKASSKEKALDYATLHMEPSFESRKFSNTSTDLCNRLLDKDPNTRLGSKGCEEIMAHAWFKDINWEMIISDRQKPPFIPLKDINAASQSEIGTFAEDRNAPKLSEEDHAVYRNWDWTSHRVFSSEVIDMLIYERETGRPLIPLTVGGTCCCTVM